MWCIKRGRAHMKKYILGFRQAMAVKYNLTANDLLLLSYINDYIDSGIALVKTYHYEEYYKITFQKIIDDLPVAFNNRRSLYRSLRKLESKRLVKIYNDNQQRLYLLLNYKAIFD